VVVIAVAVAMSFLVVVVGSMEVDGRYCTFG